MKSRRADSKRGVTFDEVRRLASSLPGVEDGTWYGTPALKVGGKGIARLREDGETLALRMSFPEREELLHAHPEAFFLTDHYLHSPAVVVRLVDVTREVMQRALTSAWESLSPPSKAASARPRNSSRRGAGK